MAVTGVVYNAAKKKLMEGTFNLTSDTIKVALVTSSYTPNIDTEDFFDDVSSYEVSGTGYTAGGPTLANKSITVDTGNDWATFDADDVALTNVTVSNVRYLVIYKSTGTPSTSPLIAVIDLAANKSAAGDTFTIQWSANGILRFA